MGDSHSGGRGQGPKTVLRLQPEGGDLPGVIGLRELPWHVGEQDPPAGSPAPRHTPKLLISTVEPQEDRVRSLL